MPLANNLVFATFDNWRLPTALDQDGSGPWGGLNRTGSEMGHLYYTELGNPAGAPLTNMGDFTNLQPGPYWLGTESEPSSDLSDPVLVIWGPEDGPYTGDAWLFDFDYGNQNAYDKRFSFYALAVRPGQRSTSVPEPATLLLLGSGLAGIAVWRKRLGRKEG